MRQLFISDLHLGDHNPHLLKLFHAFMEHFVSSSDTLFILGDLFEVWIGDDAINETSSTAITLMRNFTDSGGTGYILHGNRDFLLGKEFCTQAGFTLLNEPYRISLAGKECVLLHGDSLCSDDIEYQKFKTMVRHPDWQKMFLSKPVEERQAVADGMRDQSKESAQMKAEDIMDVTPATVVELFLETDADIIIHGHTHRQNRHDYYLNDKPRERIVLGDWGANCSVLVSDNQRTELTNLTLEELQSL